MGVKRVGAFNLSLLGKWCWRMLVDKKGLWFRVLKARYGVVGGQIREGDKHASIWWNMIGRVSEGICEGVGGWFDENVRREVGNGRNTLLWYDTWIGDTLLRFQFPRLFELAVENESKVEGVGVGR